MHSSDNNSPGEGKMIATMKGKISYKRKKKKKFKWSVV
jgi:hypothetical protein